MVKQLNLKVMIILAFILNIGSGIASPTAKLTVKVVDTQGEPIEGAKVGIGFERRGESWDSSEPDMHYELSDADGLYTAEGASSP